MAVASEAGSRALLGIAMSDARELVRDLGEYRPWIYWTDFLASLALGYGAFAAFPVGRPWSAVAAACLAVCVLALYRAVIFVHEIVHMPGGLMPGFRWLWNVLCGVPLLVPSFFYEFHSDHHSARTYGTRADGEYVAFAGGPRWRVVAVPVTALLGLPALFLRFLVLAPLSWAVPRLRPFVLSRASALAIDADFRRTVPGGPQPARWLVQEAACCCYCACVLGLTYAGVIRPARLLEAYAVVTLILLVNWLRVLGVHRYEGQRDPMSLARQVLDSVDYAGPGPVAELWAPLGLRYHAVHHLFPWLPCYALPAARRRLLRALPPEAGVPANPGGTADTRHPKAPAVKMIPPGGGEGAP